jgi:predicted DNA-binding transcriptional regulator AlpA
MGNIVKGFEANKYITTNDASKMTGLAVQTLHNFRAAHIGPPYVKINRKAVRYSVQDLIAWMEAQKVSPGVRGVQNAD